MLLAGILQDVESPGSVYSIMPQLVTSNFVAICGSKFPPTVSKHCQQSTQCSTQNHTSNMQYQQSQLLWYPRCCFLSPTSWQPLSTNTVVLSLMLLHACQHTKSRISHFIQRIQYGHLLLISSELHPPLQKMSNCQNTAVHFNNLMSLRNVVITSEEYVHYLKYKKETVNIFNPIIL